MSCVVGTRLYLILPVPAGIPVKIVCATLRSARTAGTATFIVEAVGAVSSAVYRASSSSRELAQGNPTSNHGSAPTGCP